MRDRWMKGLRIAALAMGMLGWGALSVYSEEKPLILSEMTWTDVRDYLKSNDMVIIPLGATEQHGPHLPLGADWYEAMGYAKMISAKTGVVVVPVLQVGYSAYHSGFPGSLSLKPETLEQVLYETVEMLVKYGFNRIMFFNSHGGNSMSEMAVIARINHHLPAMAVAIGEGSELQKGGERLSGVWLDEHSGIEETSVVLAFQPELVRMERAEKPEIHFSAKAAELLILSRKYPQLGVILSSLLAVPSETQKGGAVHEISSNGILSVGDPQKANREMGEKIVKRLVDNAVNFIQAWKQAKK